MLGRGRLALVAATAAALAAAAATTVPQALGTATPAAKVAQNRVPNLVVARFGEDAAQGLVYAVRHRRNRRVVVGISLRGLEPNQTWVVAGSTQPCSAATAFRDTVFGVTFRTVETESIWVPQGSPMRGPMRNVKSVRVYEREEEAEVVQRACAPAGVFIGGGAATGALVG